MTPANLSFDLPCTLSKLLSWLQRKKLHRSSCAHKLQKNLSPGTVKLISWIGNLDTKTELLMQIHTYTQKCTFSLVFDCFVAIISVVFFQFKNFILFLRLNFFLCAFPMYFLKFYLCGFVLFFFFGVKTNFLKQQQKWKTGKLL